MASLKLLKENFSQQIISFAYGICVDTIGWWFQFGLSLAKNMPRTKVERLDFQPQGANLQAHKSSVKEIKKISPFVKEITV